MKSIFCNQHADAVTSTVLLSYHVNPLKPRKMNKNFNNFNTQKNYSPNNKSEIAV
jgi:hypothetical protein